MRLRFLVAACPCLAVKLSVMHAEWKHTGKMLTLVHTHSLALTCRLLHTVKLQCVFLTLHLQAHPSPIQQPTGRQGIGGGESRATMCIYVHVCACTWGWVINQTTSTQPPNSLTRQRIYIPLHTCQEIPQQWIITPGQVLWRGGHAGSDRDSSGKRGAVRSISLLSFPYH